MDRLTPCVVEVRGSLGSRLGARLDPRSDARLRSRLGSRPDLRSRLGASLLLNRARVRAEAPEPPSCVPEKASCLLRIASHVRLAADFGHETEFWHGAVPKRAAPFIVTRHYVGRYRRWAGKRHATARIPCQNAVSWPFSGRFAARAFYRVRGHADTRTYGHAAMRGRADTRTCGLSLVHGCGDRKRMDGEGFRSAAGNPSLHCLRGSCMLGFVGWTPWL